MSKNFFDDPEFMHILRTDDARIRALSVEQNRGKQEIIDEELTGITEDIESMIANGIAHIKKRLVCEKYPYLADKVEEAIDLGNRVAEQGLSLREGPSTYQPNRRKQEWKP